MPEPGVEDASRRTRLANERTYLAWWRTGLAAIAVCVGVGRIVPDVTKHAARWPFEAVGAGYGVLAVAFLVFGYARVRTVERALARGELPPLDDRLQFLLVVAGVVLAALTVLLVLVD